MDRRKKNQPVRISIPLEDGSGSSIDVGVQPHRLYGDVSGEELIRRYGIEKDSDKTDQQELLEHVKEDTETCNDVPISLYPSVLKEKPDRFTIFDWDGDIDYE